MKQLLFCYKSDRKLLVRESILTDVVVPVEDIISPQKTTLAVPKNDKVQLADIVVIKDNNSGTIEYIGYVETIKTTNITEMECYPLINVFDNDFILDQMFTESENKDGTKVDIGVDVVSWLESQIKREFVETKDPLQAFPLEITRNVNTPIFFKKALDTANLFDVYVDLFLQTGVYIVFTDLVYERNEIIAIKCEIRCNRDNRQYRIFESDPAVQKVNIVDNTFSSYNKIIATEEIAKDEEGNPVEDRPPQQFVFYLLNDNSITRDPNDPRRIKQVRSKAISFTLEGEGTQEENAKSLMLTIYNELQAPEYDLKIEIDMIKNENLLLYKKIDFVSNKQYNEDGQIKNVIYTSNITKIERLNERQVRITLGALRNSLTDFKKKVEAI